MGASEGSLILADGAVTSPRASASGNEFDVPAELGIPYPKA